MSMKPKKELPGTSRQDEEQHLQETLSIIQENVEKYSGEVSALRSSIDTMLAHFHDDNPELINELENADTMYSFMSRTLERNERALKKPYFGRIDFYDEKLNTEECAYIGRCGVNKDVIHPVVIDWRAPIANTYYENGLGKFSYQSPTGESMQVDLKLKRTYEIENGELQNVFDTEVIANDDILTKYLSKNKQAVLGEIVATIQKEQNDIIRKTPYHNCLVQGVAGSGKTTVAMHRISFILYNYAERFRPEDFYIVGSNRILLNYITGVLPDLDVYGVKQMTMEQLFVRLLYEDWDEKKSRIKSASAVGPQNTFNMVKGKSVWFRDLERFCEELEWKIIPRESVYLNPKQFVEGFENGKTGVFDRTGGKPANPKDLVLLMSKDAIESYIKENPNVSIQSKIDMLNERLMIKVKDEFLGKGVKYTKAEQRAILKAYRGKFGSVKWKKSIYVLYEEFLREQAAKGLVVDIPDEEFDVYDLAALAYLYKRVKETEVISEAHHVVIDEAQDFGMMAYHVLKFCIKDCTYTIMGDVSQNIHFGYGLNDWEELKTLYLKESRASFATLKKSYRNTVEISDFATKILHHGKFAVYPVEPIIRHGNEPKVLQVANSKEIVKVASTICRKWQKDGLETIAVICRDWTSAQKTRKELGQLIEIMESDMETAEFGNGIMVLPVEYTKGLEFDAVLILDPDRADYPVDDGHAKLLYVAATRALHELCVLHTGNLTGLIADPVPQENVRMIVDEAVKSQMQASVKPLQKAVASSVTKPLQSSVAKSLEKPLQKSAASSVEKPLQSSVTEPVAKPLQSSVDKSLEKPMQGSVSSSLTKSLPKAVAKSALEKPASERTSKFDPSFGDLPKVEILSASGHAKTNQAVRWVTKKSDGLYLQSAYGILRISPINKNVIRITFTKGIQMPDIGNGKISQTAPFSRWKYRDSQKLLELVTEDIYLQVEKTTGAIRYMTRDKKLLLSENNKESRLLETTMQGQFLARQYFDWEKSEKLYGLGIGRKAERLQKSTARYISHKSKINKLPMLMSEKGYGLVMASDEPVFCSSISSYGTQLCVENTQVLDYYFLKGNDMEGVIDAYEDLCGRR